MDFKEDRQRREFLEISPYLRLVLCDAECWLKDRGCPMLLTDIERTDEEQAECFKNGWSKKKYSVHQFKRGTDARKTAPQEVLDELIEYINKKYPYGDGVHATVMQHEGSFDHLHFQTRN